jgi:hypothetical protein
MNLIYTVSNRDDFKELKDTLAATSVKYNIPDENYFDVHFDVKDKEESMELQKSLTDTILGSRIPGQFHEHDD